MYRSVSSSVVVTVHAEVHIFVNDYPFSRDKVNQLTFFQHRHFFQQRDIDDVQVTPQCTKLAHTEKIAHLNRAEFQEKLKVLVASVELNELAD
ncbi:MAG: hypothetical protein COA84_15870 [Robiginitomaculum sp.]|nr:MAG: hypothetical protein COA84_15870 [Robiginitomaculum sp.]